MTYTPDGIDRLQGIDWQQPGGGTSTTLATYSHMGSRVSQRVTEYGTATGTTNFSFDVFGRLESIEDLVGSTQVSGFQYVYDKAGNLLKEVYDFYYYDHLNRLSEVYTLVETSQSSGSGSLAAASSSITLDLLDDPDAIPEARAEILRKTGGIGEVLKHHRDPSFRSRLSAPVRIRRNNEDEDSAEEVEYFDPVFVLTAIYVHDGFNRRVIRVLTEGTIDVRFSAYDGWREVEEFVPEIVGQSTVAVPVKQFIWGDRLDEQVAYKE